ncbi:MAG TPA: DUF1801 domain-containing protein [Candidatus Limnocylindria bacterium]|nr:DUF1801 domain-containing protein [Candidatus Limnocylindria bacterium]
MPASKQGTATDKIWTDEERAAIQESARERKKRAKLSPEEEREAGEQEVQAKIAEMSEPDRSMATRIHALVQQAAPVLVPRTYYGMPAYAKDGKTICFFQPASKFKVRYSTFGFQPDARIDDGEFFPVAFAVTELTPAAEGRIAELVKRAVS